MTSRKLSVLCIEDEPDHSELLHRALAALPGLEIDFRAVEEVVTGLDLMERNRFDVVFVDHGLGVITGGDVVRTIRGRGFTGSIIMVTAHWTEQLQQQAGVFGADDCLSKTFLTPAAIASALRLDGSPRSPAPGESRRLV